MEARKAYDRPRLRAYGDVRSITKGNKEWGRSDFGIFQEKNEPPSSGGGGENPS